MKKVKAIDFYHNLIRRDYGNALDHNLNTQLSVFDDIKNLIFRKLTTQKQRLFPLRVKYLKKIPYFSGEFSLDYLQYIIKNDPDLPYKFYPKSDYKEIDYFLSVILKGVYSDGYLESDFQGRWNSFEKTRKEVGNNLKYNLFTRTFDLFGFKSVVYPDTGIFPDNYNLKILGKRKHNICLDIGAYIGDSAYAMYKELNPQKIYGFEPDNNNNKIFCKNIKLNNLDNVVESVKYATGLKKEKVRFESLNASSGVVGKSSRGNLIDSISIDQFVEEKKLNDVDLIKMDIEGAEMDTLLGSSKTIKKYKPDLIIALYHRGQHFFEIPKLVKKYHNRYNLRFIAMSGASPVIERFLVASTEKI